MARDRDLLSDKEFFRKTADIAEHVRECKIDITYWDDDNKVIDKSLKTPHKRKPANTEFILNIATPAIKGLEKFTAFNHEIGHIMMQTPMPEMKTLLNKWMVKEDWHNQERYDMMWNMMNVLEDQRIESMMARLWLANEKRFVKARTNLGKKFNKNKVKNNPVDILLMHRFFRSDLVSGKRFKHSKELAESLENIVGSGRLGVLVQIVKLKHIVDEYFKDLDKERKKKLPPAMRTPKYEQAIEDNMPVNADDDNEWEHDSTDGDGKDHQQLSEDPEDSKTADEDIDDIINAEGDDDALSELQNDWTDRGEDEVDEIRDSMGEESTSNETPVPSYVLRVKRVLSDDIKLDEDTVNGLKKIFRAITEKSRPVIGYDGDEIDIESYIENKIRGYDIGRCFKDMKKYQKASVLISIDGSGSMENGRIEIARQLVASLFASVKNYPNIELKANIWSSNTRGDVGITDINNLEECKNIVTQNDGQCMMTPTHLALDYSARQLKAMKGKQKLMILITDGLPQYQNNFYTLKRTQLASMNKKALNKARRATPNVMIVSVGMSNYGTYFLEECFGTKRIMNVKSMYDASDVVVNKFKQLVKSTLSA